ncbi:MAG: TM2 domain-containing protein [Clostridia bacterium]|nr:TM2 domain-containing protein [Clostridia bacterium]
MKDYNKAQKKQAEKSRAVKNSGNEEKPAKLTKPVIAFYLCLLFGWTGAHRFYTRKYATGVLYLLTFGLLCVGWITDGGALCFLALCLLLLGWVVDIVVYGCAAIKSSKQTQ